MNSLTRWNPFQEMQDVQRRMSSLFDWSRSRHSDMTNGEEAIGATEWAPLVDIAEDEKEYLLKIELPEIRREDVKLTVEKGTLTISGERKTEVEEKNRKFHRVERSYGRFERSFLVPDDAEPEKVKAEFREGILQVHLPKSEKARPKQIEVSIG